MKLKLVPVGNSKGLRLPQTLIKQYGLEQEVELQPKRDHLVLRAARPVRAGWDAAFARMRQRGDDELLDPQTHPLSEWERKQWQW